MLLDNRLEKFIYLMCGTKSKLKGRYSRPGEIICAKQDLPFHFTGEKGAFILKH